MTLSALTHSLLTGGWKLDREVIREQRAFHESTRGRRETMLREHAHRSQYYASAQPSIARPSPNQLSTPEDYRQAAERIVLIRGARQMEEDGGFFDGILDDFETYTAGDEVVYLPNTGNADADKLIREYTEWQFSQADFSERLDLTKIAQLTVRTVKRDGECGFVPVDVGDAIKLHYYSGDCIGNPTTSVSISNTDYNGIEVNPKTGAPKRYNLFKRAAKMNVYTPDRSVRADQFWHVYDPFRFQQYHGVSVFKNALRDAFDIDQILEFTKLNIKWRSSQLPTVHTETGKPRGGSGGYFGWNLPGGTSTAAVTATGEPAPKQITVDGVSSTYLNLEEKVMEYPHDFPNAQLMVAIEEFRRQCCKGAKLPYEFVYKSDNGGVVQRFWANKAENTFLKDKHLLKWKVLNPYKNRVIQKGIDTGELNLDAFGTLNQDTARFNGTWQLGRQISVDYGHEVDADLRLIEAGLMSPQDCTASRGGNLDDVTAEIESYTTRLWEMAARIGKKVGQPADVIMPFLVKKFPNPVGQQQSFAPRAAPTEPAPALIAE